MQTDHHQQAGKQDDDEKQVFAYFPEVVLGGDAVEEEHVGFLLKSAILAGYRKQLLKEME